jgi:hypothetical protein
MQAVILSIIQKPILVTLPFSTLVVYFVQKIYLRTSRQLRFLELESVSAVYSSFLETVCSHPPHIGYLAKSDVGRWYHDNPRIRLAKEI